MNPSLIPRAKVMQLVHVLARSAMDATYLNFAVGFDGIKALASDPSHARGEGGEEKQEDITSGGKSPRCKSLDLNIPPILTERPHISTWLICIINFVSSFSITMQATQQLVNVSLAQSPATKQNSSPAQPPVTVSEHHTAPDTNTDEKATSKCMESGLGKLASLPAPARNMIKCEGEYWLLTYAKKSVRLKHRLGFVYLALILRAGRNGSITATELTTLMATIVVDIEHAKEFAQLRKTGKFGPDGEMHQAYHDEQSIKAMLNEIETLNKERAWALTQSDIVKVEDIDEELGNLRKELNETTYRGKSRCFETSTERMRKSVGNAIKRAIDAIEKVHPQLAAHLRNSIWPGATCHYSPELDAEWDVKFHVSRA